MILSGQVLMRRVTSAGGGQGRLIFGAGLAVSLETFLAEAERDRLAPTGGKRLDFPLCFPARHGLGVARTGVDDFDPDCCRCEFVSVGEALQTPPLPNWGLADLARLQK
jgi:hypothetical protein